MRMALACWARAAAGRSRPPVLQPLMYLSRCAHSARRSVSSAPRLGQRDPDRDTDPARPRQHYTTALPPALAAAARGTRRPGRKAGDASALLAHAARFRAAATALGFELLPSDTPMQPIVTGSERRPRREQCLLAEGLWVPAIRRRPCRPDVRDCVTFCRARGCRRRPAARGARDPLPRGLHS